jgi:DNA polymerase elongation subunit (family B)
MVVITRPDFKKEKYEGAFVFIPKVGMYHYVCDLDASSLYPSTNMTYLISHENFICKVGGLSLYELYVFHKLLRYIGNKRLDIKSVRGLLERPLADVLKEINIEDPDAISFLKEFKKVDLEKTPATKWLEQTKCELITYTNFKKQSAGVSLRNVLNLFLVQILPLLGTNFSYTPNGAFWKRVPNWKENLSKAPIFPSMLYVAVNDRKKYKKIRDAFGIFGNLLKKISA